MNEVRERLKAHRQDVGVLLKQAHQTACLYSGFRLAGVVGHLARAQALLSEELEYLPGGSKGAEATPVELEGRPAVANEDATPVDGISLTPRPEER